MIKSYYLTKIFFTGRPGFSILHVAPAVPNPFTPSLGYLFQYSLDHK